MMRVLPIFCLLEFTILVICNEIKGSNASNGKCGIPESCCIGRDSSCFAISDDSSIVGNELAAFENSISEPCYCDEGCLETGDCCSDYEEVCNFEGEDF